jgi:hypothetical protein
VTDGKSPSNTDETETSNSEEESSTIYSYIATFVLLFSFFCNSFKTKRKRVSQLVPTQLQFLPSVFFVLTDTIQISMWWIGVCLSYTHQSWAQFNANYGPKLQFQRQPRVRKPPDKLTVDWYQLAVEHSEREEVLRTKRSFFARIFRLPISKKRQRYMIQALIAAIHLANQQPTIIRPETKVLRNHLRPYKRGGVLMTAKLNDSVRLRLRKLVADEPLGLLGQGGDFQLIVDTGCTKTGTAFIDDFQPGTLHDLPQPIRMDGIAGGLTITQEGKVRYEVVDDKGDIQVIIATAYYIPDLGCRLFSPQAYFRELIENGDDPDDTCEMQVKHDKTKLVLANGSTGVLRQSNSPSANICIQERPQ